MLWNNRRNAETAHPTQEKHPRLPKTTSRSGLKPFQEESGLSWAEITRRLDIHHEKMRRWRKGRARPSMRNMMALVALARPLGFDHLFTE